MNRSKPLRSMSKKRRAALPAERAIKAKVIAAAGGVCGLRDVDGAGPCFGGPTFQHVVKAAQGGKVTEANGAVLCWGHNSEVESNADVARIARSLGLVKLRVDRVDDAG